MTHQQPHSDPQQISMPFARTLAQPDGRNAPHIELVAGLALRSNGLSGWHGLRGPLLDVLCWRGSDAVQFFMDNGRGNVLQDHSCRVAPAVGQSQSFSLRVSATYSKVVNGVENFKCKSQTLVGNQFEHEATITGFPVNTTRVNPSV